MNNLLIQGGAFDAPPPCGVKYMDIIFNYMKNKNYKIQSSIILATLFANLLIPYTTFAQGLAWQSAITISNTGAAVSNYEVNFQLDTASLITANKLNADCSDLRVFDSDQSTNISFWIQDSTCNTATTKVWAKISSIGQGTPEIPATKTIYIKYGDTTLLTASNGNNVFLFFDDFNGNSIDSSKWSTHNSPAQADGYLDLTGGNGLFAYNFTLPADSIIQTSANPNTSSDGAAVRAATSATAWAADGGSDNLDLLWWFQTLYLEADNGYESGMFGYISEFKDYYIAFRPGNADTAIYTAYNPATAHQVYESTTYSGSVNAADVLHPVMYAHNGEAFWDFIMVRNYSATEPSSTIGIETAAAASQNVPEFSTYMLVLTALVAGWMLKNKFQTQGQEV